MIDRSMPIAAPFASSVISATNLFQCGIMSVPANARRVYMAVPCLSVQRSGSELSRMVSLTIRYLHCSMQGGLCDGLFVRATSKNEIDLAQDDRHIGHDALDRTFSRARSPRPGVEQVS